MSHRRAFLGSMIGGVTGAAVAGAGNRLDGPGPGSERSNPVRFDRLGSRGKEILRAALRCHDVEAVAVADVYTRRLDEAKGIVPGIATFKDYRALLDDKTIDAVLIATPQHLHALHFVAAIQAGKDVYQEKTMAFNPGHARRMRNALAGSGRVVQIGMQMNSGRGIQKVRELVKSGDLGTSRCSRRTTFAMPPTAAGSARSRPTATPTTSTGRHSRARRSTSRSIPSVTSTGGSSGTTPAATCSRTWSTRSASGSAPSTCRSPIP